MKNKILNILILLVFVVGIVGSSELFWTEITLHGVCPKIVGIPACYIVFCCLIIPLTAHVLSLSNTIYFVFSGIAFIIALYASVSLVMGNGTCPKSVGGIHLCFYSLAIFSSLLLLKFILIKNVPKSL